MNEITFVNGTYRSEITVKKSRFICSLKGDVTKEEAESFIQSIKKEFPDARHNCFAYVIDENTFRYSDDGEPQGTAGIPMLEVMKRKGLSQSVLVITRYFGGILLGAPGLVSAYTDCAVNGIESAKLAKKAYMLYMEVTATYQDNANIEALARKKGYIKVDTVYEDVVKSTYIIEKERKDAFVTDITEITKGKAQTELIKEGYTVIPSKEIQ